MKKIAIYLMRAGLSLIYAVLKLLPTQESKIVFLSRQSDELTLDFAMVQAHLKAERPTVQIVTLCNRLEGAGSGGLAHFALTTLRSMYHLATARVCVLDAYWPAVSLLHHKRTLTVIQMWHALGKIKQSGYQTLGKASGRSAETARLMKMHENYDYIIAGGAAWNPYYCQSFHTTEDKLVNCGLPRIDHLLATAETNRAAVLRAYPELIGKTVILYAPTFRKNITLQWEPLIHAVEAANRTVQGDGGYVLIVKGHPNQQLKTAGWPDVYDCPAFKAVDLLAACDYLITDYSAIAIEGAVLNRPTYYFVYDYEAYREKNGMNIDLFAEMPGCVFRDGAALIDALVSAEAAKHGEAAKMKENDDATHLPRPYPADVLHRYQQKYLPAQLGTSTAQITALICRCLSTAADDQAK